MSLDRILNTLDEKIEVNDKYHRILICSSFRTSIELRDSFSNIFDLEQALKNKRVVFL